MNFFKYMWLSIVMFLGLHNKQDATITPQNQVKEEFPEPDVKECKRSIIVNKLTCSMITKARLMKKEKGTTYKAIGKHFGVTDTTISRAIRGLTHKDCK